MDMFDPAELLNKRYQSDRQHNLEEAVRIYSRVVEADRTNWPAYVNRACALNELGRFGEALSDIEMVLVAIEAGRWAPESKDSLLRTLYGNRGFARLNQGDIAAAISNLQHALEYEPDYAPEHAHLGTAFRKQGDLASARKHYDRAIELFRDKPKEKRATCEYGAAIRAEHGLRALGVHSMSSCTMIALRDKIVCQEWIDSLE